MMYTIMKVKIKQTIKKIIPDDAWAALRRKSIIRHHKKIAYQLSYLVNSCDSGCLGDIWHPSPKVSFSDGEKVIWQYWAQGFDSDDIPYVVRICLKSVEKYAEGYHLIRLSDDNLNEYLDIPDWLVEKRKVLSIAHFADIIRCMLLSTYGGVWLDSAILLTGPIPKFVLSENFFMYQRDSEEPNKRYWENTFAYYFGWDEDFRVNVLIGIMGAQRGNVVIKDMTNMLLAYWMQHDTAVDYFFFQVLFDLYIKRHPERNCKIHNDCIPHYLRQIIVSKEHSRPPVCDVGEVKKITNIHSLNYKNGLTQGELNKMFTEWGLL